MNQKTTSAYAAVVALNFVISMAIAQTSATTCNLSAPPEDAARASSSLIGEVLAYPDPKSVPTNYSGCLSTWVGGGVRMIEAKFENGKIRWYRMGDNDLYCEYENDQVVKEVASERMRKGLEQYPPQMRSLIGLCPPGAQLIPSKWK